MIVPLADRVIVERTKGPSETPGGVILPDTAKQQTNAGKVIAVGPGELNEAGTGFRPVCPTLASAKANGIEVGDTVYFSSYSGNEVVIGDKKYLALSAGDIIGFEARS